jgi:hypothetical protein
MKGFRTRSARWVVTAGTLLFLAGCGGTGTVAGKVTLDGQPLPGGLVTVNDSEGQSRSGGIHRDGAFSISNIAPGPAQVTVLTTPDLRSIRDPDGARGKEPFGPYVKIPEKYKFTDKSGFYLDVKSGRQEFDLPLQGEPAGESK